MFCQSYPESLPLPSIHNIFVFFQIYALNKIMTEMEEKLFMDFCRQKADTS